MLLRSLAFAVATALVASRSVTAAAKTKQVFAHVMFGEVQGYEVQDYVDDQVLAREVGIDALYVLPRIRRRARRLTAIRGE